MEVKDRSQMFWQKAFPWGLVLLLLLALFFRLGFMELRGEEARRGLVALEMLSSGHFWMPTLHGLPYLNKPPLYLWVLMVFFSGPFPASELLLRIPGVLSGIATGVVLWKVAKFWFDDRTAIIAGLMYLTSADLLFFGLVYSGEIDPFYALITFGQMATLYLVFSGKISRKWFLISFALAAMGIMTKGLPSIFHQGVSVLVLTALFRRWKWWIDPWFLLGLVVMAGIPAAYFRLYLEYGDTGSYLTNLYWESVKKSGAVSTPLNIAVHLVTFPLQFLWLLLPWSVILVKLMDKEIRNTWWADRQTRYLAIFLLVNLSVYWISPDTRNRYLYPFLPWMILLMLPLMLRIPFLWVKRTALVLIVLRLVYSTFILPIQVRHFPMRESVIHALEITGNAPVRYLEDWDWEYYSFDLPLFGRQMGEIKVTPSLHYKIPFYFMSSNGKTVGFDTIPVPGQWYITRACAWPGDSSEIVFRFPPKSNEEPLVLAKKKAVH